MQETIDKFWADDIFVLFEGDRLTEFWITKDMHNIEKLNALMRFSIYFSILLGLYKKDLRYAGIIIFVGILTIFINYYSLTKFNCPENFDQNEEEITVEDRKIFKTPTLNNPFMNSTIYDLQDPKVMNKRAIPYPDNSPKSIAVKNEIKKKFDFNVFKDFTDIYGNSDSQREFYTMPAEFTAHDRNAEFRKFLFGDTVDSSKSNSYTSINGIYTDYGRK